jgi:hypothetical protein
MSVFLVEASLVPCGLSRGFSAKFMRFIAFWSLLESRPDKISALHDAGALT